jgi:hypothetical protein
MVGQISITAFLSQLKEINSHSFSKGMWCHKEIKLEKYIFGIPRSSTHPQHNPKSNEHELLPLSCSFWWSIYSRTDGKTHIVVVLFFICLRGRCCVHRIDIAAICQKNGERNDSCDLAPRDTLIYNLFCVTQILFTKERKLFLWPCSFNGA